MTTLNQEVAEKIMGWKLGTSGIYRDANGEKVQDPERPGCYLDMYTWTPDQDMNQSFMVVERMRELGWLFDLTYYMKNIKGNFNLDYWMASYYGPCSGLPNRFFGKDTNPCLAILKAAKATEGR